jgi:hypothetical protein
MTVGSEIALEEENNVEIERRKYELQPVKGEELEAMAQDVIAQPLDVIERMRKLLGK